MINYEAQRVKMVDNQVRTTDVTSHSVLSAFLTVARENFVPESAKAIAYTDADIEVAPGRYLSHASPLAKLIQLAGVSQEDKILEIGTGTGYVTALLGLLGELVLSLESDAALSAQAAANLSGYDNVKVITGDMEKGVPADSPFDLIFINGSVEHVPQALLGQLKDGGRLVAVVGYGNASRANVFRKERGTVTAQPTFNTAVKPLPGFRKVAEFQF